MTIIICIHKSYERDLFIKEMKDAGVEVTPVEGLVEYFSVEGYSVDNFPFHDHSAIKMIEDGDEKVEIETFRTLDLPSSLEGSNWALARHVRRDPPWNPRHIKPLTTYVRQDRDGTGVDIYLVDARPRVGHIEFGGRLTEILTTTSTGGDHGTPTNSIAGGLSVGMAPGALLWNASWGSLSNLAILSALGAVLSHYNGRSGTNRPAVCSNSWSSTSDVFGDAIADLIEAGIVVCASAGNQGIDMDISSRYPASYEDVICVGALFMDDTPARYNATSPGTNYGSRIDVSAAGERVWSADNASNTSYRHFNGTSAACPLVAGVVACMLQNRSRLTGKTQVQDIRQQVIDNATTGRLVIPENFYIPPGGLPDRILYLDPGEFIPPPILPSAKRHWRILITENHGDSWVAISKIQFHETAWGPAIPTDTGTATSSGEFSTGNTAIPFTNVFPTDRDFGTNHAWISNNTSGIGPWWIAYDFGEGNEVEVNAVTIINAFSSGPTYNLSALNFSVQSSIDGLFWETEWSVTGNSNLSGKLERYIRPGEEVSYTGSPHGAHTQWRTFFARGGVYVGFAQIEMRDTPGGTDQSGTSTFSGSSEFNNTTFSIANAFDGNPATPWVTVANENENWLQLESVAPFEISEIAIREKTGTSYWPRHMFVGYRDGSGYWTITYSDIYMAPGPAAGEWRTYQDDYYIP